MAVIDSGSDRSHMNVSHAKQLGLPVQTALQEREFVVGDGRRIRCSTYVVVTTSLTSNGEVRAIEFWVTDAILDGSYALIGHRDLRGYAVEFGSEPTLEALPTAPDEDSVDPITPPDFSDNTGPTFPSFGDFVVKDSTLHQQTLALCHEFRDIFSPPDGQLAKLPPFQIKLVPRAAPVKFSPRPMAPEKRAFVTAEVQRLLDLGMIRPSKSPWAAPVVVVREANGKLRMCGDYSFLNQLTVKDAYPIPDVAEILAWIARKPYLAKFDMVSGYNQIPVDADSAQLLAFVTHDGLFEPTCMPFGPTNAPAHFQRELSRTLSDVPDVRNFFDDVPLAARTPEQFLGALRAFFSKTHQLHIRINGEKSIIGPAKLPLLGRLVGPTSIQIDPENLGPLPTLRAPQSRKELRSFLGLAQWFASFVPNMAQLLAPVWDLTKTSVPFVWTDELTRAFEATRDAIVRAPILAQFVPGSPIVLRPDYSTVAIGGAIYQRPPDGTALQPLLFYGRKLTPAESRYCTIEGECLAIVLGFQRCRPYILPSTTVTVVTDHSNLQFLRRSANPRVQRWLITLSEFRFDVVYAPGDTNAVADCLSRLVEGTVSP